ncbi:MAG: peroxiredoxin [Rickettsiales bacterium]|nr:peroxiredoxin [Rickettsiales bacterium]
MITIGDQFPAFSLKAVKEGEYPHSINDAFIDINNNSYKGKWQVIFFWPKDFTFVCPTEIVAFANLKEEFEDRETVLLGASTDSEFVHLAWKKHQSELNNLPIPMLADVGGVLSNELGILSKEALVANRATFIIDPDGVVRFVSVTDLNVGRNPNEVLRVLDALQTDELCPCNWNKGEETIKL